MCRIWARPHLNVPLAVLVLALVASACSSGGSGASSGGGGSPLTRSALRKLNDARLGSYMIVSIWDHLNDHCGKAYGPPQPSDPYANPPPATPREAERIGHCTNQLYHWLNVKGAVMTYARTMQGLEAAAPGACKARLGDTSERLSAFAGALDRVNTDLASYDIGTIAKTDGPKMHVADKAYLQAEQAMLSACRIPPMNLSIEADARREAATP